MSGGVYGFLDQRQEGVDAGGVLAGPEFVDEELGLCACICYGCHLLAFENDGVGDPAKHLGRKGPRGHVELAVPLNENKGCIGLDKLVFASANFLASSSLKLDLPFESVMWAHAAPRVRLSWDSTQFTYRYL